MPQTTKTWSFASDAQGLADAGNHAGIAFGYTAGDGSPAAGSVDFTTTTKNLTAAIEYGRPASTGETWESWGVPAGSIVTAVQITAWNRKTSNIIKATAANIKARVIGSGGGTVHTAGDLLDVALSLTAGAWGAGSAGTERAVDAGAQASSTDVRLELEHQISTSGGGGSASEIFLFDELVLTITYTAGGKRFPRPHFQRRFPHVRM